MKTIKYLSLFMLALMTLPMMVACGGDDDNDITDKTVQEANDNGNQKETPSDNDNYYVKYEVTNGKLVSYSKTSERHLRYKDVDKEKTITVTSEWEGTYGPFKKGDRVYLYVSSSSARYNANARLSVSKNKEAFTIKAEQTEVLSAGLVYTIDY